MDRIIIILLFVILAFTSHARIGMGDWTCDTPNGNRIDNFSGVGLSLHLKNGQQINNLTKWYFYKKNILGQLLNGTYFVANENTSELYLFKTESEFHSFIKAQEYEPAFWTRWYSTKWNYFSDILFIAFISFPISIPLFFLFCFICYKSIIDEKLNYKKPFSLIFISALMYISAEVILAQFPQSI